MKINFVITLAFVFCATFVSGCAVSEKVFLRNPAGQTVQCGPYTVAGNLNAAAENSHIELRGCIADYQRQGYERVPN